MAKPTKGNQKGAQPHAEGQHGDKTRNRLEEMTKGTGSEPETRSQRAENDPGRTANGEAEQHERMLHEGGDGGHRLVEGRKQHDDGERNSERNRQDKDEQRHKHADLEPPGSGGK